MSTNFPDLPPDVMRRRFLDTRAAAAFLSISPNTLRKMIVEGTSPPATRIGVRRWGFRVGDLVAWGGVKPSKGETVEAAR